MRFGVLAGACLSLLALSLAIRAGGQTLIARQTPPDTHRIESPDEPRTAAVPKAGPPRPSIRPLASEPSEAKKPPHKPDELDRIAPRDALSEIGLALPSKPPMPDDWKGTILYRPLAPATGLIVAMGHSVAIAGIEPVGSSENCSFDGKNWPCGIRARAAFRAWLRGRAVTCAVPPEPDRAVISAACRLAKQDVGAWLVENGWARAGAGSPYAEAGEKARSAKKGIFGPPPAASGLPAMTADPTSALPAPLPPETPPTPPVAPTGPFQ